MREVENREPDYPEILESLEESRAWCDKLRNPAQEKMFITFS